MAALGPEINEANYIASQLKKNVSFSFTMMKVKDSDKAVIVVDNKDYKQTYNWNPEKFRNRLVFFREYLDDLLDDGVLQKFGDPKKDPFWDPEKEAKDPYPEKKKAKGKDNGKEKGKGKKNAEKVHHSSCCTIY
jgi:hypothetical protein